MNGLNSLQGMLQLFMDFDSSDLPRGHSALEFADFAGCVGN